MLEAGAVPPSAQVELLSDRFVESAFNQGIRVAAGRFQAVMDVEIRNDGPITAMCDTDD